jgi:acetolactate synthase I/II/III large subunit
MKLYSAVCAALAQAGVDTVFAVMGNGNQELLAELSARHGVRFVHARHEQNAVAMADGYARATGGIGVASVTQGPGLTNACTSLACAARSRTPVLVLAGAASLRDPFNPQALDQEDFARISAGAGAVVRHADTLGHELDKAFRRLRVDEGPYVLSLPADIQHAELGDDVGWTPPVPPISASMPDRVALSPLADVLARAACPVILAGRGVVRAGAEAVLGDLASRLGAPITTSLLAKGLCRGHPLYAGVGGGLGDATARGVLQQADVLLAVGTSLNQWTTYHGSAVSNTTVIHIDSRPEAFHAESRATWPVQGDAGAVLRSLVHILDEKGHAPREPRPEQVCLRGAPWSEADFADGDSCDPRRVITVVSDHLRPTDVVVADGGHVNHLACQGIDVPKAQSWHWSNAFGAIGQGLGMAIGAAFAQPVGRVVHVTGDASFLMNVADLDTAARHDLPLTVVVLNDGAVGQERHDLEHKGLPTELAEIRPPDFTALADGFGANGVRVRKVEELDELVHALQGGSGVTVVDVRINPEVESTSSWAVAQRVTWGSTAGD